MKTFLKWLFGLVLLVVVLAVVLLLSLDTILRTVAENRIRAQTGMDVEIGKLHFGLLEPVVTITDLKIYNPPSFGGTPFLNIPEIHVEYDRAALAKNQIHLTLMRFNLGELDIVKNEAGQTNLFALGVTLPKKNGKGGSQQLQEFKQRTGLDFQGIDVLNVSVGTVRFIDLKNPSNNRAQKIGIDNLVMKNVKTRDDMVGLAALVALRGSDVFGVLVDQKSSSAEIQKLFGF
ncbi:MAG TPA: hypothetical protein VK810_04260 [Dongiaceae bacterium]|jgi:uncharacterized protein involved in outer membrane biogenesis|nr:hypothetical protein [Dongiaceae bacterium]